MSVFVLLEFSRKRNFLCGTQQKKGGVSFFLVVCPYPKTIHKPGISQRHVGIFCIGHIRSPFDGVSDVSDVCVASLYLMPICLMYPMYLIYLICCSICTRLSGTSCHKRLFLAQHIGKAIRGTTLFIHSK